jgi:hypothetical protein
MNYYLGNLSHMFEFHYYQIQASQQYMLEYTIYNESKHNKLSHFESDICQHII